MIVLRTVDWTQCVIGKFLWSKNVPYSEKEYNQYLKTCFSECIRNDQQCIDACPCAKDCPDGCYDCRHPLCEYNKKSAVLVLNTRNPDNQPFVIDFSGKLYKNNSYPMQHMI